MTALLEAKGISKFYGAFRALNDVSFSVNDAEVISLIGPNGAGKTSIVNVLTGYFPPSSGSVLVRGKQIAGRHHSELALDGVARSFQLISTFPTLTVGETLGIALDARAGSTYSLFRTSRSEIRTAKRARELADVFGLVPRLEVPCNLLSQGEKKLLDVATTFALDPSLIILDEPTSGVASSEKHAIMQTLLAAAKRQGVNSLLIVEHDMELVRHYSTRILGLKDGALLVDLPTERFFQDDAALEALVGDLGKAVAHA